MKGWRSIMVGVIACAMCACSGGGGQGASGTGHSQGTEAGVTGSVASGGSVALRGAPPQSPWIESVAYHKDGSMLVFATADGGIWELDLGSGEASSQGVIGEAVENISLCQAGGLALAYGGEAPRLFNVGSSQELLRFAPFSSAYTGDLSTSGKYLALATSTSVGLWHFPNFAQGFDEGEDLESYLNRQEPTSRLEGFPGKPSVVEVNDSGQLVLAVDDGTQLGTLFSWRADAPEDLTFLGRTNATVTHIAFTRDEKQIVAVTDKQEAFVATFGKKGFARWAMGLPAVGASWTADGALVVHEPGGTTRAYEGSDGSERWSLEASPPLVECWSRGSRLSCSDNSTVTLLDPASGAILATVAAWSGKYLTYLPDGAHHGTASASDWLSLQREGAAVDMDPSAWASLTDPARVGAALNP